MIKQDVERAMHNGTTLWTTISGKRVAVKVLGQRVEFTSRDRRVVRYVVGRIDTGTTLPKRRSAQALHCSDGADGDWPGMTETQDRPSHTDRAWAQEHYPDCRYGRRHCGCAHDGGRCEWDTETDGAS